MFHMTARTAKQSTDFAPVANWWGGSTGAITKVHIEIIADQKAQLTKYESGGYSLIGFANQSLDPDDVVRYNSDPQLKKQLQLNPSARTTWIGFNFCEGAGKPSKNCAGSNPFAGDAGKLGREAFSLAVDRDQLVDIACSKGTACTKATGGVITKGLKGYLADNTDPWAVFDKAKTANAKPLSQSLDTYKQTNKILVDNTVTGNLVYGVQQYVSHPYVKGVGGNALYDNYWADVKILQH